MTSSARRNQLLRLIAAYDGRLGTLYDSYLNKLTALAKQKGVGTEELLEKDALFHFDDYPELTKELDSIFNDYLTKNMLTYKAGITDGVALAFSHESSLLSGFSILSDKALSAARATAATTFLRTRMKPESGMGLSQLVWNYCSQTRPEFEVAISNVIADGLKKGTSAEELGRLVRQYLNNPDMMYRRYHRTVVDAGGTKRDIVEWRRRVVGEDGKVHFVTEPLEQVGMGHYRSSRKNATRLMRTEINMAYHNTNYERWQEEPFVIGIHIHLSPQHPVYDICDEVEGFYPKDFRWSGWHPQCMCTSDPITLSGEEKKEFYRRLASGEDMSGYVSPNRITDVPDGYKRWIEEHHDEILRSGERGKLAYHLSDNTKYWLGNFDAAEREKMGFTPQEEPVRAKRIKTEEEKADIQRRWDERKKNNEILTRGKAFLDNIADFPELRSFGLADAVEQKDYSRISSIVEVLHPRLRYERSITPDILLDRAMRKKYGDEAVEQLYSNVKRTISSKVLVKSGIDEQIKALRFEADWVVKNRSFATVKEVAAYYEREAVRLEAKRDFERVRNEIMGIESRLSKYGVKTILKGDEWYGDVKALESKLKGLEGYKDKLDRIEKIAEFAKTTKSTDVKSWYEGIKFALNQNGIDANVDALIEKAEKRIERILYDKEYARRKKLEKELGEATTLDDLKRTLGKDFPRTLQNLQDEIDRYVKGQGLPEDKMKEAIGKIREVLTNGDFGMNVPRLDSRGGETLDKIMSSYFKSQIETGTGNGAVDVDYRKLATRYLFGADVDALRPREFEKYGFLMDRDILAQSKSSIARQYWNNGDGFQIRFKKDRVIATFTMEDSLGSGLKPSLVTDPQTSSFGRIERILKNTANHLSAIEATQTYASSYIELQYHGNLTLDCIESIFIPDDVLPKLSKESMEALVKAMERYNFKVFSDRGDRLMQYTVKNGVLTPL